MWDIRSRFCHLNSERNMKKAEEIKKNLSEQSQNKIGICLLTQLLKCKKLSDVICSEFLNKNEEDEEKS